MIDTIVLVLSQSMYAIAEPDKFEPSARGLYENKTLGGRSYTAYKQNPTKSELRNGIYKPRLTVTTRYNEGRYERPMKIEFSAPKLIKGNNFDELEDSDLENLVTKLKRVLFEMGVFVSADTLLNSPISAIHFSKNIKLMDGLIPFTVLKELSKTNITKRLDYNQSDFRNEGHSIKWHTNSWELTFYDKVKDLAQAKKSEKRAIEKDNFLQMSLLDDIEDERRKNYFEILRMELRLNSRQKIKMVLKENDLNLEPILKNLFGKDIAKKILIDYLNRLEEAYPKILQFSPKSDEDFITQFISDNPKASLKDMFSALGFRKALEVNTPRELRELIKKYPNSSWYKLFSRLNGFQYKQNRVEIFSPLKSALNQFTALKLVDFYIDRDNN